jgi:transposase
MIKGTKADVIINHLKRIPEGLRRKVTEITLDMASPMINICKAAFPQAKQVTDRFHVQKLVNEAVQDIRIKHRWDALDKENEELEKAKLTGKMYNPEVMATGDTIKQLLARSRYVLFKHYSKWTERQNFRAELLFQKYPDIQQAYNLRPLQKLSNNSRVDFSDCFFCF